MREVKKSVYQRIADDVKWKVETGILREGDKLPSCRDLAIQQGINPNTVQRAYSELEEQGYIYTLPKKGVYVSGRKKNYPEELAKQKIEEIKAAGITKDNAVKILNEVYGDD
ncbi:MAG: GntR family transcriptional regulator [Clostridia bacterium]|nr:GntR family transcriptional regulator [Clostridia bacterium]